jgi:hypothetical protein
MLAFCPILHLKLQIPLILYTKVGMQSPQIANPQILGLIAISQIRTLFLRCANPQIAIRKFLRCSNPQI